ncbi:non-specific lipid transfer protein GPI-anchored 3-like [Salvia splendens]|uniref:non-specific lipid transfer protein GPI-anchored 3-like n=1 Tax=Salvia splendens TaxID=180675 RepID=UPI001C275D2F|nr:non-specific lipid transfer protein GPI-anchored 3-like [Salvia splendens]
MEISKLLLLNFLVICCLGLRGYCEVSGGGEQLPCIQKLLPCQAYLKGSASLSPAVACCVPLKEMASSDAHCLCAVFNNQAFLKNLNVTQEDALNLVKSCGANADISICSKEAAASSGPPSSIPSAPSSNSSETSGPPNQNAGTGTGTLSHVGVSLLLLGIIVSLF